jgi:hypothetical protein
VCCGGLSGNRRGRVLAPRPLPARRRFHGCRKSRR